MLIRGDARELPLADESVDCVVTSPPYWGLRDYGTATWLGGDPACTHRDQRGGRDPATSAKQLTNQGTVQTQYAKVCRDCGAERVDAQLGLEATPDAYVAAIVSVFAELARVLKPCGVAWLNLGDSYASGKGTCFNPGGNTASFNVHLKAANVHPLDRGSKRSLAAVGLKPKDLVGIPWRVALALQAAGWYLRADVIWHKPNPMPESITDRPTKAHEYLFLLTKSEQYYYDADAIREPWTSGRDDMREKGLRTGLGYLEQDPAPLNHPAYTKPYKGTAIKEYAGTGAQNPSEVKARIVGAMLDGTLTGRNKRSVWTIPTMAYSGAHFATMPEALIEPCILAGCPPAGKRCDCDELIGSPLGEDGIADPTLVTGRAGFNRPRLPGQGRRLQTRREQRDYAAQLRDSAYRGFMEKEAGSAFEHYIRTDLAGARAIPPELLTGWRTKGWLQPPKPCVHGSEPAGIVLDPFIGSGTVGAVAERLGRRWVGVDLSYQSLSRERTAQRGLKW